MRRTKRSTADIERAEAQGVLGRRFELHPGTDLWMRGARYGEVKGVSRDGHFIVEMDKLEGYRRLAPELATLFDRYNNPTRFSNPFGCNCG